MRRGRFVALACLALVQLGGCAGRRDTATPAMLSLTEVFPGVRIDASARVVEFDAQVSPLLVNDPRTPLIYLEVLCCIPDTREHESLVVTRARPSHIHAALLALGAEPGAPGGFRWPMDEHGRPALLPEAIAPTGDALDVRFVLERQGNAVSIDPLAWVVNARNGSAFPAPAGPSAFVFAGSRPASVGGSERYAGDLGGNVVGLSTFGDEVVALRRTMSPDSSVETPEWVARLADTPAPGTPVRVRLQIVRDTEHP